MKVDDLKENLRKWIDGNGNLDFLDQAIKDRARIIADSYDKNLHPNEEDRNQAEIDNYIAYNEEIIKYKTSLAEYIFEVIDI